MIKQTAIGLASRELANPYNENGFLPLITAPMYSVVDETNYQIFLDNKIQVCLPRNKGSKDSGNYFTAVSLQEFKDEFIGDSTPIRYWPLKRCIDTANGNMPELHNAIRKAKEIHGDNLIIMAGNVASVEAFIELAKTGVDYIRVGIGGGGGCNTTSNTGVGQENLEELIQSCNRIIKNYKLLSRSKQSPNLLTTLQEVDNTSKVKIIADGISSYIKLCQEKYGFNDNGYAAINKLLFAGADLVMVGKLFAQCIESAGEKGILDSTLEVNQIRDLEEFNEDTGANDVGDPYKSYFQVFYNTTPDSKNWVMVKYLGMSTQEEQKKYKSEHYWKWWWGNSKTGSIIDETVFYNFEELKTYSSKHSFENSSKYENYYSNYTKHRLIKPSEGSVSWIPVRFLLKDWIKGNSEQDSYPFLMGFENSLRSAMSYAGSKTLEEFKNGK